MLISFLPTRTPKTIQPEPQAEPSEQPEPLEAYPDARSSAPPTWRRLIPFAGGLAALALAGWAESIAESLDTSHLALVLYLIAILVFAVSAWYLPPAASDLPAQAVAQVDSARSVPTPGPSRRRTLLTLGIGIVLAVALNVAALFILYRDLKSLAGALLWLASLAVLLGSAIAVSKHDGWAPRWGVGVWPRTPSGRWLLALVVVALLALAAASRFLLLDQVPLGVNADEGDRAALSIRIVRGTSADSIFDIGWYWIANMYFWLLAQLMKVIGIGYVQARAFSAIAGLITVAIITWMGARHFGLRVGLIAGALAAMMGVMLQFSRFTSEAGPTAMLWTLSGAFFLEAARRGKLWAWIGAGLAGGFALYFYPTGKLWVVVAAGFCLYLLMHGLGNRRWAIFRGAALAALASIMIMAPFILNAVAILKHPEVLYLRAQETSIFTGENATRLVYYRPGMSTPELLVEQAIRTIGIFNQWGDAGGTWPTQRPITFGLLAVLTLLGLGWTALRWRDPRCVLMVIWFWVGFVGMAVTVDTPSLQRMATSVPLLPIFAALTLDNLARRVEALFRNHELRITNYELAETSSIRHSPARWAIVSALVLVTTFLMWSQWRFYFVDYAVMDKWMHPTAQGRAVAAEGTDTLVVTIGRQHHMINSGWVRLMAPDTPRGGIIAPGSYLPLTVHADKDLTFMLYNQQAAYMPYLQEIYPGGVTRPFTHTTEGLMFTFYQLTREQWAATQGAIAHTPDGKAEKVSALGEAPPGWSRYPSEMRWTAGWRVPQHWNYSIEIGPGPAQLTINGTGVLTVPAGTPVMSTTLSLARGDYYVEYTGTLAAKDEPALFRWASLPEPVEGQHTPPLDWQPVAMESLIVSQTTPVGLYATVQVEGRPDQQRIDRTLATCCLTTQVRADGRPYTATWTAVLDAPVTGVYSMTLFSQGMLDMKLDGDTVFHVETPGETFTGSSVHLSRGPHQLEVVYHVPQGPGAIEWAWTPPDRERSIVPPSALSPPPGAGVGPPTPFDVLGRREFHVLDNPLEIVK